MKSRVIHGLMAEFDDPSSLVSATERFLPMISIFEMRTILPEAKVGDE